MFDDTFGCAVPPGAVTMSSSRSEMSGGVIERGGTVSAAAVGGDVEGGDVEGGDVEGGDVEGCAVEGGGGQAGG